MKPLNTYLTEGEIKKSRLAEPTSETYFGYLDKGSNITEKELSVVVRDYGYEGKIKFCEDDKKKYGVKELFTTPFGNTMIRFDILPSEYLEYYRYYKWIQKHPNRPYIWDSCGHGLCRDIDPPITIERKTIDKVINNLKRYVEVVERAKVFIIDMYEKYGADKDVDISEFRYFLEYVREYTYKMVNLNGDALNDTFKEMFNVYYVENYEEDLKKYFPKY